MAEADTLTLDDAAKFATKHAGTEVTESDFCRAAARGEIVMRAIVHNDAKVQKFDGGIYCNSGKPNENLIVKGAIPTLPISACRQLANAGQASWRTMDGYATVSGEFVRYEIARLADDEPDYITTLRDCRVTGYDVHALADAFIPMSENAAASLQTVQLSSPQVNAEKSHASGRHKLRTNTLDGPISKAITLARSLDTAPVFLALRELALNGEVPFTGEVVSDSLCYTNDDNKHAVLTKNALGKRLKRFIR